MLTSAVLAAGLSIFTISISGVEWGDVLATIFFAGGLLISIYLLAERPERQWYDARAVAESVKTMAWRYSAGGSDFPLGAESDSAFLQQLTALTKSLEHVSLATPSGSEITPSMRQLRNAPLEVRRHAYRQHRIDDQQSWYSVKARFHGRRATQWLLASLVAQLLGITAGLLQATETVDIDLLGLAAAVSAAIIAWLQMQQHSMLAEAYGVTARELSLVDQQLAAVSPEGWPAALDEAEAAISREHTLWRARRSINARQLGP